MNCKKKCILIYFIVLPFIDLITALLTRFTDVTLSLGMIIKGLTLLLVVGYCFFWSKSKYKKKSIIYYVLVFLFALIYFCTKINIWSLQFFIIEITKAFKYLYFPLLFMGLLNIFEDFDVDNIYIKKILFINCLTYTFLLLVPFLTSTSFNSYYNYKYKGSNGWFYAANETGIIMTILISSLYCLLDKNKKWKVLIVIPAMMAINLIGTKVSFLGLVIVSILIVIKYLLSNKNKSFILAAIFLIFLGVCVFNSPTAHNVGLTIDFQTSYIDLETQVPTQNGTIVNPDGSTTEETTPEEVPEINKPNSINPTYKYETLDDIISNKIVRKILGVLLSGRADFFAKNYGVFIDSGITNILFGLGWNDRPELNYTFDRKLVEIDVFDILIHYGVIGFILYFIPTIFFVLKIIKNIRRWKIETLFYTAIMFLVFFASVFAGHIFAAPAVSIYLILIMIIVNNLLEERTRNEE